MHDRRHYVILAGDTSVSLGRDFKRLTDEESPISVSYQTGGEPNTVYNLPCRVLSREEVERQLYWPWIGQYLNQPVPGGYIPIRVVFLEKNLTGIHGGEWQLKIPPAFNVTSDSPYNVSGYYFPRPLERGTDENAVTNDPDAVQAVINKAISLAYFAEDPTSQKGIAANTEFENFFSNASYTDSLVKFGGRVLRM